MSSRLHNKFHRHNHHTTSTNDPRYPDASYDPIASYAVPFNGPFVATNPTSPTQPPSVGTGVANSTTVAIDAYGDINVSGSLYAANRSAYINANGQFVGDGSQLTNITTTSIVNLSGSPYQFGGTTNPTTSIIPSFSGIGNLANAPYSVVAGGSANQILTNSNFSFIAGGSANSINGNVNTFVLGSNITTSLNNYTYVNNLSSLGTVYATTIGASSVNAKHLGDGSLLNLTTNSLSAATTTLVNTVSTTLNASITSSNASITSLSATTNTLVNTVSTTLNVFITSLSAGYVSNTALQNLSGNWQNVYSLVNTTTATTFMLKI